MNLHNDYAADSYIHQITQLILPAIFTTCSVSFGYINLGKLTNESLINPALYSSLESDLGSNSRLAEGCVKVQPMHWNVTTKMNGIEGKFFFFRFLDS